MNNVVVPAVLQYLIVGEGLCGLGQYMGFFQFFFSCPRCCEVSKWCGAARRYCKDMGLVKQARSF